MGLNAPSALSQLLVVPEYIALHDHMYCSIATNPPQPFLSNRIPSKSVKNVEIIIEVQQIMDAVILMSI